MEVIHTDVLIIGGGLAGLRAALAAPRGQSQHRRTGMAVDLELHVAAQHPAPFLIICPLDHGSILLLSHKLIALGVIGVPHSGKPGTQRGLVLIQILAPPPHRQP